MILISRKFFFRKIKCLLHMHSFLKRETRFQIFAMNDERASRSNPVNYSLGINLAKKIRYVRN